MEGEEGIVEKFSSRFPRRAPQLKKGSDKKQKPMNGCQEGTRNYQFSILCRFK